MYPTLKMWDTVYCQTGAVTLIKTKCKDSFLFDQAYSLLVPTLPVGMKITRRIIQRCMYNVYSV